MNAIHSSSLARRQFLALLGSVTAFSIVGGVGPHEYTPTKDPLETLDKMMSICEV